MYGSSRGEGEEGDAEVCHRRGSWSSYGGGGEDGLLCGSMSPILRCRLDVIVDAGGAASHGFGMFGMVCTMVIAQVVATVIG